MILNTDKIGDAALAIVSFTLPCGDQVWKRRRLGHHELAPRQGPDRRSEAQLEFADPENCRD